MRLSKNFTLSEMTKSQTAERKGIHNYPSLTEIDNLIKLSEKVLQPVRDHFKKPVTINSGFRCLELNRALGSKDSSQHTKGMAADIEIAGVPNKELAEWIRDNLEFDQLILEFYYPEKNDPNSGWVHVSFNSENNRKQCLTINRHGVSVGF